MIHVGVDKQFAADPSSTAHPLGPLNGIRAGFSRRADLERDARWRSPGGDDRHRDPKLRLVMHDRRCDSVRNWSTKPARREIRSPGAGEVGVYRHRMPGRSTGNLSAQTDGYARVNVTVESCRVKPRDGSRSEPIIGMAFPFTMDEV